MPSVPPPQNRGDAAASTLKRWATGTFAGRFIVTGLVVKLVAWLIGLVTSRDTGQAIDTFGDISVLIGAGLLGYQMFREVEGVFLWRVSRKLTLSYIFIGLVPVLLVIVLSVISGTMLFFTFSAYMTRSAMKSVVDQADALAQSAAVGLQGITSPDEVRDRIERRQAAAERRFPFVSYAVVPTPDCEGGAPAGSAPVIVAASGRWAHIDPPSTMPSWLKCSAAARLTAFSEIDQEAVRAQRLEVVRVHALARAVAWTDDANPSMAVVVDIPLTNAVLERMREETGVSLGAFTSAFTRDECEAIPMTGREVERPQPAAPPVSSWNPLNRPLPWVSFVEYMDWNTARTCQASINMELTIAGLYARVAGAGPAQPTFSTNSASSVNLNGLLVLIVAALGVLFLIILIAAFVMGFALARSITGAVHELFTGTERVRRGDFTHKIVVQSRDQLGELAESFNSMTSSIEDLLQEKAEKERMEQELRIARNIQMSLLPHGGITTPGLALTAHCEPAREVGGDYYDYLPLPNNRLGLLVADVAGKGTSAALYMAELKGLMLSLSELHSSPRKLLIDANRIISRHLDSRSFITITYAVVDVDAGTLTYARAGHCPLIYVPGAHAIDRTAQILAPDGLVLGLQIDNGERFEKLLMESTVPLGTGDVFLFYTDGLTEAMDAEGNCFGDSRLAAVVQQHADLPSEELRERILREIAAFSRSTDQQDDMTMLLLKVEDVNAVHAMGA
jgi:serine phosphatase RsbU (regulator of sigma subunit)